MADSYFSSFDLVRRDASGVEIPLSAFTLTIRYAGGADITTVVSDASGFVFGVLLTGVNPDSNIEFYDAGATYAGVLAHVTKTTPYDAAIENKINRFLIADAYTTYSETEYVEVFAVDETSTSAPFKLGSVKPGQTLTVPFESYFAKDLKIYQVRRDAERALSQTEILKADNQSLNPSASRPADEIEIDVTGIISGAANKGLYHTATNKIGEFTFGSGLSFSAATLSVNEAGLTLNNIGGTLGISKGGSGQTTANAALNAFLPTQTGNSGKVLGTDGSNTSWVASGLTTGNPVTGGGANRLLYEDASQNLAASAKLTFASDALSIGDEAFVGDWAGGTGYACFGNKNALASSANNYAVLQTTAGATYFNTAAGGTLNFRIGNTDKLIINDGYFAFNATADSAVAFWLKPMASNKYAQIWQGLSGQSAPIIEVRDSGNATRFQIGSSYAMRHGYDNSNYWEATVGSTGGVTFDAVGSGAKFTFNDDVEIADGKNIIAGATTGLKIGTATSQKLGFFNAAPVTQRTNIGAITDSTSGAASNTVDDPTGGSDTVDVGIINDNFATIVQRLNRVEQVFQDLGLTT